MVNGTDSQPSPAAGVVNGESGPNCNGLANGAILNPNGRAGVYLDTLVGLNAFSHLLEKMVTLGCLLRRCFFSERMLDFSWLSARTRVCVCVRICVRVRVCVCVWLLRLFQFPVSLGLY